MGKPQSPPSVSCLRPLRVLLFANRKWRGTEIPPSPKNGFIRARPFHHGLVMKPAGGRAKQAVLSTRELREGLGSRQVAAFAGEGGLEETRQSSSSSESQKSVRTGREAASCTAENVGGFVQQRWQQRRRKGSAGDVNLRRDDGQ